MAITYTAEVFCDRCGNWTRGVTSTKNKQLATKALASAKNDGWSRDTKSLLTDLCPSCLKDHRQNPAR